MRAFHLILVPALATLLAGPVLAADRCDAPKDKWRPVEELKAGEQGQVVLDVSGEERARMDVPDLLAMFERTRGEKVSDDALLLG